MPEDDLDLLQDGITQQVRCGGGSCSCTKADQQEREIREHHDNQRDWIDKRRDSIDEAMLKERKKERNAQATRVLTGPHTQV